MKKNLRGVGCILAEMCTGSALFPGTKDVVDQLDRIFSIRGMSYMISRQFSAIDYFENLLLPKNDSISKFFLRDTHHACNLIEGTSIMKNI